VAATTVRTPICFLCHRAAQITIPTAAAAALGAGALVQDVLPEMPRPMREQLITGTHPACWTAAFGDSDPRTCTDGE
jgi:hypothetical protein